MPFSIPPVLRVLLVAGHGYSNTINGRWDSGATGCGFEEAELVRGVADRVISSDAPPKTIIIQELDCDDACIRLHPSTSHLMYSVFRLNAHYRPEDFIISLHMNAADNPQASGVEVYYANEARYQRKKQAELVARVVSEKLGLPNRGTFKSSESQHSRLAILDDTRAPALLIELGFITNETNVENVRSCGADAVMAAIDALRGFQ